MNDEIRAALILRYRAAMAEAEANIQVYLRHPAGIGEHSDIVCPVLEENEKAAAASEKLDYISGLKY